MEHAPPGPGSCHHRHPDEPADRPVGVSRAAAAVLLIGSAWGLTVAGPWAGATSGIAAGVGLLSLAVPGAVTAQRLGRPIRTGLVVPFVVPVLAASLLNSAAVTLWRGGVRWRDTFYPLAALRAGRVG